MDHIYDVIILGAGPAGLSAGLYAGRSRLDTLIIEKGQAGGQIINTDEIENYPGQIVEGETGVSLVRRMYEQTEQFGAEHVRDTITDVELNGEIKVLTGEKDTYQAKNIIIATGAYARPIGCKGEQEYKGRGISYCATCDGAFFKDKTVAVVGGGDVAVEDAVFLARGCKQVYLIHRRDQLRAAQVLQDALKDFHNITCIWDTTVEKIGGEQQVQWITLKQTKTAEEYQLDVDGVFIAVGTVPDTGFVKELVDLDEHGYIKAGEDGRTDVSGIYAAGDIRTKELRQIITAAADGANCVNSAQQDLYKR